MDRKGDCNLLSRVTSKSRFVSQVVSDAGRLGQFRPDHCVGQVDVGLLECRSLGSGTAGASSLLDLDEEVVRPQGVRQMGKLTFPATIRTNWIKSGLLVVVFSFFL